MRITRKGLVNNLIAATLFILLVLATHYIGNIVWISIGIPVMKILGKKWFFVVVGSVVHTTTALLCLIFFIPAYLNKGSWLDKYRVIQVHKKVSKG